MPDDWSLKVTFCRDRSKSVKAHVGGLAKHRAVF